MDALDRLAEPGLDLLAPGRHAARRRRARGAPALAAAAPDAGAARRRRPQLPRPAPGAAGRRRPRGAPAHPGVRRRLRRAHRPGRLVRRRPPRRTARRAAALLRHLDEGPESLVGRLESTAGYADALADWVEGSRLRAGPDAGRRARLGRGGHRGRGADPAPRADRAGRRVGRRPRSPPGCWRCSAWRTTGRRRCCASGRRAWPSRPGGRPAGRRTPVRDPCPDRLREPGRTTGRVPTVRARPAPAERVVG